MSTASASTMNRRSFIAAGAVAAGAMAGAGLAATAKAADASSSKADKGSAKADASAKADGASANPVPAWLGEAPVIDDSQITDTIEADVVVVGAGNGGSMCAFAAAEAGAKVAVIEAQDEDSMSYYGLCDIANVNSNFSLSQGSMEINKSQFIAEFQRRSRNRTNPALVKQFADNSGPMMDWLVANAPQDIVDAAHVENVGTNEDYIEMGGEINNFKCWNGSVQFNYTGAAPTLIKQAEDRGATWYWGHTGVVLTTEEFEEDGTEAHTADDGTLTYEPCKVTRKRVTGVIAQDEDGNYKKFVAKKGIVLACGDYGANSDMYVALQDEQRALYEAHGLSTEGMRCLMGRDGSGIKMGLWAGGSMDPVARPVISPQVLFTSDHYAQNVLRWACGFKIIAPQAQNEAALTSVNPWGTPFACFDESGNRFMDETFLGVFGQVARYERRKPGRYFFFFDNKWPEALSRMAPEHMSSPTAVSGGCDYQATFQSWVDRGPLGAEVEDGGTPCAWAANSLDELFQYMGFTDEQAANFKAGIDRYNEMCANGEDEDFGRDPKTLLDITEPPFYGMFSVEEKPMTGIVTLSGLVIGDHQEVLDKNYNPIDGLYATGNNSGGRFAVEYSTPMQGMTIGMAMTLGRVLGQQLAAKE